LRPAKIVVNAVEHKPMPMTIQKIPIALTHPSQAEHAA
jgi:hypothetical protein